MGGDPDAGHPGKPMPNIKLSVTCGIQPKTVEKPMDLTHTLCGRIHGRP